VLPREEGFVTALVFTSLQGAMRRKSLAFSHEDVKPNTVKRDLYLEQLTLKQKKKKKNLLYWLISFYETLYEHQATRDCAIVMRFNT
jgi:hypothetical protein